MMRSLRLSLRVSASIQARRCLLAHDLLDRINRFALRFEVSSADHFSKQAGADQLNPGKKKNHAEYNHRPVLRKEIRSQHDLLHYQPQTDERARGHAHQTQRAKKMERPCHILDQEANRQEIKQNANGSRKAVMRLPARTHDIANRNFGYGGSIPGRQRRYEAMHLAIEPNLFDGVPLISFERSAEIVNVDAG